jgi:hypothetical protein
LYSRQLHCYAYALENAGIGKFALQPVTTLGLLVFEPDAFSDEAGAAMVQGKLTWINIPRDDRMFMEFLADVLAVLELPTPAPGPEWVVPVLAHRQAGLIFHSSQGRRPAAPGRHLRAHDWPSSRTR